MTLQTTFKQNLNGKGMRIGVAVSRFNEPVITALFNACVAQLKARGVAESDIETLSVPGALELPIALQRMARRELGSKPRYHALIALGAVIRGETYHFEVVSNESSRGIMEVSLDVGIPIANGVLTVQTDEQAHARVGVKGAECADVAIELANLMTELVTELGRP